MRGLIDLAKRLEGLARNVGTHAGGVVIAPQPITEYMPLYADADGALLTQLDKDDLEAIGLIKFDFLGLKTLTIIDKAVAAINRESAARGEPPLNIDAIPVDDAKTYELLRQCRTTAVFQLESLGMRDLIKRLQPDRFDDLTAIVALFRPGPMQMADEFIARKHRAGATPDYLHPRLETMLKPTYGVILYQEQVMQIAQILAGYSLGGADLLRRAMGKKKPEEMAEQRSVFLKGATERGVEAGRANHIFDQMETFAGYGFNKSHAAAYALIAYQTAWLKAHYPEAYMAAVLTADLDNTDRLVVLKDELKRMGIVLEPPDVNASVLPFTVPGPKRISYGLGALKGVGPSAVEAIVAERDAHGRFTGLVDLCRRVDLTKINRRVLEALAKSGALDSLGANRATLMHGIPSALQAAERSVHAQAAGQTALFGGDEREVALEHALTPIRDWSKRERLDGERESLGLYLTGHPFEDFAEHCKYFTNGAIAKVLQGLPSTALPYQRSQGSDPRRRRRRRAAARQPRLDRARRRHGAHRGDDVRRGLRASEARHREARGVDRRRAAAIRRLHQRLAAHGETDSVRRRGDRGVRAPAHDPLAQRVAGPRVPARAAARLEAVHARPLRGLDRVPRERRRSRADARRSLVRARHARPPRPADAPPRRRQLPDPLPQALRLARELHRAHFVSVSGARRLVGSRSCGSRGIPRGPRPALAAHVSRMPRAGESRRTPFDAAPRRARSSASDAHKSPALPPGCGAVSGDTRADTLCAHTRAGERRACHAQKGR